MAHGLRRRPPCRRCGQSHWPPPTADPTQGLLLRHSVGGSLCREAASASFYLGVPCESSPTCSHPVGRPRRDVPFLTGQKGDGKSRRATRAAADGAALRRGRESQGPGGSSRGLARTSAMASLRHRFATRPSAAQRRPRRHTAKGPENESAKMSGEQAGRTALFPERPSNRSRSAQRLRRS
jgi:hypothetical protein